MTCFRTKEGITVRKLCKTQAEYTRFYRAMDNGATVEEAMAVMSKPKNKSHHRSPLLNKLEKVLESYDMNTYFLIHNYFTRKRTKDIDEAIRWAARTGRVTLKHQYREEYLKIC